jgi:hypothetical protein
MCPDTTPGKSHYRMCSFLALNVSGNRVHRDLNNKKWTCATPNEVAKLVLAELKTERLI